ncbi:hypothetical protein BDV35DRAFT_320665 [Aspergillus flavus]|uniref:Uncharacterized protein n=1 Tax=Aspergillus flavus TaxID=5059 RepID=A0A5N6GQ15_ASPFL|nr:hypothetical protein BDV35DRAFT_320665 [Aspergillus flavus]
MFCIVFMYFSIMLTMEWVDTWICSEFWAWSHGLIIFHVVRLSVLLNVRQDSNALPPMAVELDHGHDWACLMLFVTIPVSTAHQRTNWTCSCLSDATSQSPIECN